MITVFLLYFIKRAAANIDTLVTPVVKNPPAKAGDAGDAGSIPGLGRNPEGGNGNPLQYSCRENPMDRGVTQAVVHGVIKSWTQL